MVQLNFSCYPAPCGPSSLWWPGGPSSLWAQLPVGPAPRGPSSPWAQLPVGPAPCGGQAGPAPCGGQAGPAPRGGQAGPAPRGGQVGPAPCGGQAGPAPRGGQAGPAPRGGQVGPAPCGGQAGPAPRGGQVGPAPCGGQVGPAPRGGQAGPAPRGGVMLKATHKLTPHSVKSQITTSQNTKRYQTKKPLDVLIPLTRTATRETCQYKPASEHEEKEGGRVGEGHSPRHLIAHRQGPRAEAQNQQVQIGQHGLKLRQFDAANDSKNQSGSDAEVKAVLSARLVKPPPPHLTVALSESGKSAKVTRTSNWRSWSEIQVTVDAIEAENPRVKSTILNILSRTPGTLATMKLTFSAIAQVDLTAA
nr:nematocyst expressed protein 3-like [Procambarus clarkii]